MRLCDRKDELSRLPPTEMVIEMWPVVGFLLVLLTCTHAQSQLTVLPPDSVEPYTNRSIIFYQQGQNGYYGNNVTLRTTYLQDSANKTWYDEETILPNGTLKKFYLMAHTYNQLDEASRRIRLQIWRPVDMNNLRLMLVWQQRVQVAASAQVAMLYTYTINQTVALVAGDRIGWAFEGKAGPISFQYTESHRTRFQSSKVSPLPEVGQTIDFDPTYMPSSFSVAVSVDDTLPEYPGSGNTGTTGALVYTTRTTVQRGYPSPSSPSGSTGTTGTSGTSQTTDTNRSIIFYQQGESGYYGNNVTLRTSYLQDAANKTWYDEEVILPNGTLRKFYLMAHNYGQLDEASRRIRLQIWRPVDMVNLRLMLVWQQLVQVAASAQVAMLYTYTIHQSVALVAGDRIGWAFEGKAGPISFQYAESHRTRMQSSKVSSLPEVGQTIDFDPVYVPSSFSVAVSVDDIYPGSSGPSGTTGNTGSLVATGTTVQQGYPSPSGPSGSTGTIGASGVTQRTGSAGFRRASLLLTILMTFIIIG